ncbi:MAG: CRISPR-associated endonuclease Cas2 [Actinobacteria bacterium]|nr:CRISPR-associated endonuclease Cas2 [Actinomycetota bacterium]
MLVLISYDVKTSDAGGQKRLRRVAKTCLNYGQRVQFSVFECNIDPTQWVVLRQTLINEIDKEKDSLRFYFLGSNWKRRIEHIGAKEIVDLEGPLII